MRKTLMAGILAVGTLGVCAMDPQESEVASNAERRAMMIAAVEELHALTDGEAFLAPETCRSGMSVMGGSAWGRKADDPADLRRESEVELSLDDFESAKEEDSPVGRLLKKSSGTPDRLANVTSVVTINRLRANISFDENVVGKTGSPSRYVCYGSSGTLTSSMSVYGETVVGVSFEVAAGSSWLKLSGERIDADGYKSVTYTASSNVGGASRYGIIKCRERYRLSNGQLAECVTWYPVGQCGDWCRKKTSSSSLVFSRNYAVLCYDWVADSGNGTGLRTVPITEGSGFSLSKYTYVSKSSNEKLVRSKVNVSKKRIDYTHYANMSTSVKSCLTTDSVKGWTGSCRAWHFVAPKPQELLDRPMTFTATDSQVTNVLCSWSAVEDATCYRVFRNGVLIGTTTDTTFNDGKGTPGTVYTYSVVAEMDFMDYALATSPSASDKGASVPLVLRSIRITPRPSSVMAGHRYVSAIGCTATFNDGLTQVVKPKWTVSGKATVTSSGNILVGAAASGTLKITAAYTRGSVTKKATASIPVVKPIKSGGETVVSKIVINGPDSLVEGEQGVYTVSAVLSTGDCVDISSSLYWSQLTGAQYATLANDPATGSATMTASTFLPGRCGTILKVMWGDYSATKRVALEALTPSRVVLDLCADGGLVAVARVSYSLPIRVDCSVAHKVTVSGLPAGLTYDSKTSVIRGVPTKAGTFAVKVKAQTTTGAPVSRSLSFSLKVMSFPSWAAGTYEGAAEYDTLTDVSEQTCPYAPGTVTVSSAGKISLKFSFPGDAETFSAANFSGVEILDGVVSKLYFKGTLKTASGSIPVSGSLKKNLLEVGVLKTTAAIRKPYMEAYRRLNVKKSADKAVLKPVAGRAYTYSSGGLSLKLVFDKAGKAKITGKTPTGRKISKTAYVLVKDGAVQVLYVMTSTGGGGNGLYTRSYYSDGGLHISWSQF